MAQSLSVFDIQNLGWLHQPVFSGAPSDPVLTDLQYLTTDNGPYLTLDFGAYTCADILLMLVNNVPLTTLDNQLVSVS